MVRKIVWATLFLCVFSLNGHAVEVFPARAGIMIEVESGRVLFAHNENERLPPASVTKVMTMLLVMEKIDDGRAKLNEEVRTSRLAAGMGGSQIFLREGEVLTLEKMLEAVAIVSANDASTALAEHLYGGTEEFVTAMNRRAREMGAENTNFVNETGLPHPDHYMSVADVALISRELVVGHPKILEYTSIQRDSIRDGAFVLHNTNQLIGRFQGADGLKTGHTEEAGFCLAATAKRSDVRLISVVFGAASNEERLQITRSLLESGFRNYQRRVVAEKGASMDRVLIRDAARRTTLVLEEDLVAFVRREEAEDIQREIRLDPVKAPISQGAVVGKAVLTVDQTVVGEAPVITGESVRRANILVRAWRGIVRWVGGLFRRN